MQNQKKHKKHVINKKKQLFTKTNTQRKQFLEDKANSQMRVSKNGKNFQVTTASIADSSTNRKFRHMKKSKSAVS